MGTKKAFSVNLFKNRDCKDFQFGEECAKLPNGEFLLESGAVIGKCKHRLYQIDAPASKEIVVPLTWEIKYEWRQRIVTCYKMTGHYETAWGGSSRSESSDGY